MPSDTKQNAVLVINCGSSSVKFALIDPVAETEFLHGLVEKVGAEDASIAWKGISEGKRPLPNADLPKCLAAVLKLLPAEVAVIGVGHRVVHGGESFSKSVAIDQSVVAEIESCSALAPLHNPANLAGISAAQEVFPQLPHVAVFDTAFHQTMPTHAYRYAIPRAWYTELKVRRYGFHGTSHAYVSREAARQMAQPPAETSVIVAHLGNGCSACAVHGGESLDTTMGLSPLEGLVMGTRSGDVDPALHTYLANNLGLSLDEITNALNKESGLLGLSGRSNDMRTLVELAESGDADAGLAIEVFAYRLAKAIGALAAALPKLDAIVFTGGIGENSAYARRATAAHLRGLRSSSR